MTTQNRIDTKQLYQSYCSLLDQLEHGEITVKQAAKERKILDATLREVKREIAVLLKANARNLKVM